MKVWNGTHEEWQKRLANSYDLVVIDGKVYGRSPEGIMHFGKVRESANLSGSLVVWDDRSGLS